MASHTWNKCCVTIMKKILDDSALGDVLTAWQSLTFEKGETIQMYVDTFWSCHLKSTIFKKIDFAKWKQKLCVGLPKNMSECIKFLYLQK